MDDLFQALQPGARFYRWLDRLFGPRRQEPRASHSRPMRSLYTADAGSF